MRSVHEDAAGATDFASDTVSGAGLHVWESMGRGSGYCLRVELDGAASGRLTRRGARALLRRLQRILERAERRSSRPVALRAREVDR